MSISREEILRLSDISELSKLFFVTAEEDFLSRHLSPEDINQCITLGSTNLERISLLMWKIIQANSRSFYSEFVDYFMLRCQQYKKMYYKLKYGTDELMRDCGTQTDYQREEISYDLTFDTTYSLKNVNDMKAEMWRDSSALTCTISDNSHSHLSENELGIDLFSNMDKECSVNHAAPNRSLSIGNVTSKLQESVEVVFDSSIVANNPRSSEVPSSSLSLINLNRSATESISHLTHHHLPGVKLFQCEVCGRNFTQRITLIRHMRIHTGEKPFRCDLCGKEFTQAACLPRHMRIHTGEKPFRCQYCGKDFRVADHLNKHIRCIHSGHSSHQ